MRRKKAATNFPTIQSHFGVYRTSGNKKKEKKKEKCIERIKSIYTRGHASRVFVFALAAATTNKKHTFRPTYLLENMM